MAIFASIASDCPAVTRIPCFTNVAKPCIVTVIEYVPAGTPRTVYVPSLCDCAVSALPEAGVNVTVAPGITALSGSATVPWIVAPPCWALEITGAKAIHKSTTNLKVERSDMTTPQKKNNCRNFRGKATVRRRHYLVRPAYTPRRQGHRRRATGRRR